MQLIWKGDANEIPPLPDDWIYKLRSSMVYQSIFGIMKRRIAPFISVLNAISAFATKPNGGLIVLTDFVTITHRKLIVAQAARYGLPAVYNSRAFSIIGGLVSYGPSRVDPFRRAASYVDRILKGANPADLPVQNPTKFNLVINRKTAATLDLKVAPQLLAFADEVIE